MAIRGFGVWALVAQGIAEQGVILARVFPMSGFRPRLPRRWTPVGSLLSFGSLTAAFGLVTYCSRNLDNVLIGRDLGSRGPGPLRARLLPDAVSPATSLWGCT